MSVRRSVTALAHSLFPSYDNATAVGFLMGLKAYAAGRHDPELDKVMPDEFQDRDEDWREEYGFGFRLGFQHGRVTIDSHIAAIEDAQRRARERAVQSDGDSGV